MRPIKICLISPSSDIGGAVRSSLELIDALKEYGLKFYAILPRRGSLNKELRQRKIGYDIIHYKRWVGDTKPLWKQIAGTLWDFFMTIPVAIRLSRSKCDIVITNTICVCVGALAAKLLGLPHIWYIREFGYEDHGWVFNLGEKLSLRLMDLLSSVCIANSKAVAKKYQKYMAPLKVRVVYQSVLLNEGPFVQKLSAGLDSKIKCIIVGTLHKGKRQEDAIRAIADLIQREVNVELIIVGDGMPPYKNYLKNIIIDNELAEHVNFIGHVENALSFIQNADVLLMCSRNEAFGRVTIEAMKAGRPVIGARSGGTTELIYEGFNGLLYNPLDYKDLADKIEYLYDHRGLAQQMGKNAQQWAKEKFNQKRYGQKLLAILEPLVKNNY